MSCRTTRGTKGVCRATRESPLLSVPIRQEREFLCMSAPIFLSLLSIFAQGLSPRPRRRSPVAAGLTGRARAGFALLRRGSASQILVLNLRLFREPMQEEEEGVEARSVRARIASEVVASGTHVSRQEASWSLLYSGFHSCATPYFTLRELS